MINFVFKKWQVLTLYLLGIIGIVIIIGACVVQYLALGMLVSRTQEYEAGIQKHQDAILKDLKLLESKPIFADTPHTKNAEEFLAQYISWSGEGLKPLETANHKTLKNFKNFISWNNAEELQNLLNDKELMQIDLSWMEGLLNYDHLNFSSHSKIKSQMQLAAQSGSLQRIEILSALPISDHNELRQFSVIYFLQQYKKGNVRQGLLILEHVVKLCHSGNNLVSQMAAVALLRTENKLKDYLKFSEATLASEEAILAYRRLSWAWIGISFLIWSKADVSAFEPYLKSQNGICAAVDETVSPLNLKDFFEPRFFFESDMSSNLKAYRAYQNKLRTACQAQHLKMFDAPVKAENNSLFLRLSSSISPMDAQTTSIGTKLNWARVPYARRLVGSVIILMGNPNWVKQYDDLATEKK